ncbi:hypothetical protein HY641_03625 [Candidatus Woesearchaeota archaeon]|nr:hypothetical protein [Candidatus Woesearchaeota archaeon]
MTINTLINRNLESLYPDDDILLLDYIADTETLPNDATDFTLKFLKVARKMLRTTLTQEIVATEGDADLFMTRSGLEAAIKAAQLRYTRVVIEPRQKLQDAIFVMHNRTVAGGFARERHIIWNCRIKKGLY